MNPQQAHPANGSPADARSAVLNGYTGPVVIVPDRLKPPVVSSALALLLLGWSFLGGGLVIALVVSAMIPLYAFVLCLVPAFCCFVLACGLGIAAACLGRPVSGIGFALFSLTLAPFIYFVACLLLIGLMHPAH